MKKYLLLPPALVLLASCATPTNSTTPGVAGQNGIAGQNGVIAQNSSTNPYNNNPGAVNTGTNTGTNTIQAVRGAREAASTVQTFRNLFGAF